MPTTATTPATSLSAKTIGSTDEIEREVKVVIATTYALGTPDSPVVFEGIMHEQPDATREEIFNLWELFPESLGIKDWEKYRDTLVDISAINDGPGTSFRYQIGAMMAGIRLVAHLKRRPGISVPLKEEELVPALRGASMIEQLKRCF